MNELQITLLVLAVIFTTALYWMGQRRKQNRPDTTQQQAKPSESGSTPERDGHQESTAQRDLFETLDEPTTDEKAGGDRIYEENGRLVIEVDGADAETVSPDSMMGSTTNFGRPATPPQEQNKPAATREPQLFAIMLLGAHHYDGRTIRHALMAQGMVYDENEQIFVMRNEEGQIYLRAANALNPGTLPDQDDVEFQTPGVALILQLPTCIHAPAAMDIMIRVARKLSQRLNARLYKMDRQQMTESDIRAMRQAALDYVSEPLK